MNKPLVAAISLLVFSVVFTGVMGYKAHVEGKPARLCDRLVEIMPKGFESRFTQEDYLGCVKDMKRAQYMQERAFDYFYDCAIEAPGPLEWAACAN